MNLSPAVPRDENEPLTIPSASSNEVCNQADGGIHIAQFESASAENDDRNTHISKGKSSKTKLNVTIRGWNGVATWKWIANDDTCGICRVAFDGCCPDCKLPGDDCPLVWGACTHCFHIHCIMKWLNSQQAQHLCPMCRQDWKFKE